MPISWLLLCCVAVSRSTVRPLARTKAIAFHKPKGLLCTHRDEYSRPTVYDALQALLPSEDIHGQWHACGRLDQNTSGLLILTNDGRFVQHVTNPTAGAGLVKRYRLQCHALAEDALEQLRSGVDLGGTLGRTRPAEVKMHASSSHGDAKDGAKVRTNWLTISITEGKNRQIRRMLHAVGSGVMQLERLAVGALELGNLAEGSMRVVSDVELRDALGWDSANRRSVLTQDAPVQGVLRTDRSEATSTAIHANAPAYSLLDSGDERRLERFGDIVVDRPCPSATWPKGLPRARWESARLVYSERSHSAGGARAREGEWAGDDLAALCSGEDPALGWILASETGVCLGLEPGPSGQVGAFPEQETNWQWLRTQCRQAADRSGAPVRVLNLFGHTGGSTLACAAANHPMTAGGASATGTGAGSPLSAPVEVTHLDGARSAVRRARANAELCGLGSVPIRWICEDTTTFVQRALRRGDRFDAIVLDPPAFGRGGSKRAEWRLSKDLPPLAELLGALLSDDPAFVLLTCHDAKWPAAKLRSIVHTVLDARGQRPERPRLGADEQGQMILRATEPGGRDLPMGDFARWSRAAAGAID